MQFNSFETYESLSALRQRHEADEVHSVIDSTVDSDYPTPEFVKPRSRHPSGKSKQGIKAVECTRNRYDSSSSDEEGPQQQYVTVCVNGADIGDLPTEYTVEGLRTDEFPVIDEDVERWNANFEV